MATADAYSRHDSRRNNNAFKLSGAASPVLLIKAGGAGWPASRTGACRATIWMRRRIACLSRRRGSPGLRGATSKDYPGRPVGDDPTTGQALIQAAETADSEEKRPAERKPAT